MAVDGTELSSWTAVGTKDAAQRTYRSIKHALENAPQLRSREVEVFVQGSYANATNLRGDSDVDVVAMLLDTYAADTTKFTVSEWEAYSRDFVPATYRAAEFRSDVTSALVDYYGRHRVDPRNKCIRVDRTEGYVDADVVPALEYRLYRSYSPANTRDYIPGIAIIPQRGDRITNFPKEHIRNGRAKNQAANERYKPTVRQMKRLRNRAVDEGRVRREDSPGYLLECMVYNVPNPQFTAGDGERVLGVLNWLLDAHLESFNSCDEVHSLFGTDPGDFDPTTAMKVIMGLTRTAIH